MASGIKDKVTIFGMGCSKFGERWDVGTAELMAEDRAIEGRDLAVYRRWAGDRDLRGTRLAAEQLQKPKRCDP